MMRCFTVEFEIRKGLGPATSVKNVAVGLDDLEPELSVSEIREYAAAQAEAELCRSADYPLYGKTWTLRAVYDA